MKHIISDSQGLFEAEVLKALFDNMAELSLRYAVLRNYEDLPNRIGARDIDIVVHPEDLRTARELVARIACEKCLWMANYYADERLTQFALVRRNAMGGIHQIKIDFFIRSEVYGIEIMSAAVMLRELRQFNGVPVVADTVLLLDKWLFHLMVGRPLHAKYDVFFASIARAEATALICILTRALPSARAEELVGELAAGRGSKLVLSLPERSRALLKFWTAQGVSAISNSVCFLDFRLRDLLQPHGVFMSVSGPDGSGKTVVINLVIAQLRIIYGDDLVEYAHFRPNLLPRIAEVAKKILAVEKVDKNYDQPYRGVPSGSIGSMVRLGYYWLDYFIGYLCGVWPVIQKRKIILFDRYYYDMVVDSLRCRILLSKSVLRLVGCLLPLPKYAFFIKVDHNEIYRRKQELTLKRITMLNSQYVNLVERGWLIEVDNNGVPEKASAEIVNHIVTQRHLQSLRRLG